MRKAFCAVGLVCLVDFTSDPVRANQASEMSSPGPTTSAPSVQETPTPASAQGEGAKDEEREAILEAARRSVDSLEPVEKAVDACLEKAPDLLRMYRDMGRCSFGCVDLVLQAWGSCLDTLASRPTDRPVLPAILVHRALVDPEPVRWGIRWMERSLPGWQKEAFLPGPVRALLAQIPKLREELAQAKSACRQAVDACSCGRASRNLSENVLAGRRAIETGHLADANKINALIRGNKDDLRFCSQRNISRGSKLAKAVDNAKARIDEVLKKLPSDRWRRVAEPMLPW